jgi:hypothetical protein
VTNANHEIYHCNGDGNWSRVDGIASQISVGDDGTVVCVNPQQQVKRMKREREKREWSGVEGWVVNLFYMFSRLCCLFLFYVALF